MRWSVVNLKTLGLSAALLAAPCFTAQASTLYTLSSFTPDPLNPSDTLSGTITTDGTVGAIYSANILEWSFTVSGPNNLSISSSDPGAQYQCIGSSGCFTASATTLSFDFGSAVANDPFTNYQSDDGVVQFLETAQGGTYPILAINPATVSNSRYGASSNIIGRAVPETGALSLVGLGLAAVGLAHGRKMQARSV